MQNEAEGHRNTDAVSACLEVTPPSSPTKCMKKQHADFQIPRTSMWHLMGKEGYYKYWPIFTNEKCSWHRCAVAGMHLYCIPSQPWCPIALFMFTNECVVYHWARSQNVYIWAKQNPHFFENVWAKRNPHSFEDIAHASTSCCDMGWSHQWTDY
jgi:hypothetical protein